MIVSVRERGQADVSRPDWTALAADPAFWSLVERQVLGVAAAGAGRYRLMGSCYVGRAFVGGRVLEIAEKTPGAFEALVRLQALVTPRLEKVPSPVTPNADSTALLVSLFVQAARTYLSGAKQVAYARAPEAGAIVGGRLDMVRTAKLRARGIRHRAAYHRTFLSADLPVNRCVYAALREVEWLASVVAIAPADLASARALRLGLHECLQGVLSAKRADLALLAAKEAEEPGRRSEVTEVVSLAGCVLDAAGFGGAEAWTRTVPRAWFVNLENLFERAVRSAVRESLAGVARVTGPEDRPPLFQPASGRYRANPDIVIRGSSGVVAIGDAKYKDFERWPIPADVYELLAHAAAYGASRAFLFYPNEDGYMARTVGRARTGCDVWVFGVPFEGFRAGVDDALRETGVLPSR